MWQVEVSSVWGVSVKGLVVSFGVIEGQVFGQIGAGVGDIVIGLQIDFLVFDRLPHPLDKDVVTPCAFAAAMDYMLKRQAVFSVFFTDGRDCLSNNAPERSLHPVALAEWIPLTCS